MAHVVRPRVCETSTTTGTGNLTLAGAVAGFQTFANAPCANNDTFNYVAEGVDANGNPTGEWEEGFGLYVSATPAIQRLQVYESSNADALVNFSSGTKRIYIIHPAYRAPSIISVGAEFSSTAVPTATLPGTHALNDILVLVIEHANEAAMAAPTGYARLGPANGLGSGANAGSMKLSMFWKRDNGSESAPTLTDTGDHTYGFMFAVRGCPTVGDPFHLLGQNFKFATSTTGTSAKGKTCLPDCLITDIFAHHVDQAGANASAPTNADLASVTEQFDDSTADGVGGGLVMVSGVKVNPGPIAATTITWTTTSADVSMRIAWIPLASQCENVIRPPEVQTFIGSIQDLDDTWTKPYAAAKVLAQICDGGGGGSGGNTTTTAAGGGGGGGGGYAEALFGADDLAATITVHAGRGGAAGTALNQAGNVGVVSEFDKGGAGPLTSARRIAGTAATAAASADGGNGGCGSGFGTASPAVETTRRTLTTNNAGKTGSAAGAAGGSGTTANTGGSEGWWGGGGGESGADTDAALTSANNGSSMYGGGGGSGGRTNTNISGSGNGGGAAGVNSAQGAAGADSTRVPYGGSGGVGGGSTVVTGGNGGFPGGGGGGGAGVTGGFGGAGGNGCVVVTTFFI